MKSTFREWTLTKINKAFGFKEVFQSKLADEWLGYECELSDYEKQYLTQLQDNFLLGGDDWNEVELENKMISPLIVFSKIDNVEYAYFLERELSASIGDYDLSGLVDGMIASGYREPDKPYFCLNEYKRESDPNGDPKGQVLIAMLVAQKLNDNGKPLFGCFIIGRQWRFIVLEGNEYFISRGYSVDDEEIFKIFCILKSLKLQIEKLKIAA